MAGLAVLVVLVLASSPELYLGRRFVDADGYMRLVRVRELLGSGGWFDSRVARSNWPDGEVLHWTRPMDLVLVSLSALLGPFLGASALHHAGTWAGSFLLLATFATMWWAGGPVVPKDCRGFLFLGLFAQTMVLSYGLPGRPDHHALIVLSFVAALGFALRVLRAPEKPAWTLGLGLAMAFGLWVSPEFLLPLGLVLGAGVLSWIAVGEEHRPAQRRWTGILTLATVAFLLLERGVGWRVLEYDRLSLAHVAVGGIAWAFWAVVGAARGSGRADGPGRRLAWSLGLGTVGLALMALAFPGFFGGPMSGIEDPLVRDWLGNISELQPLLFPNDLGGLGLLLTTVGSALLVLPFLVRSIRREGSPAPTRILLLFGLAVVLPLSLVQTRWAIYAELLAVVGLAQLVSHVRTRIGETAASPVRRDLARGTASAALIAGPLLLGTGVLALTGLTRTERLHAAGVCDPEQIAGFFGEDGRDRAPRTIAAYLDLGPAILYRTPHRVLATPYHRNAEGIRKVRELFTSTDLAEAEAMMDRWEVDVVVLCPSRDEVLFDDAFGEGRTLYERLVGETPPPGFVPVPGSEALSPARVFERISDPED